MPRRLLLTGPDKARAMRERMRIRGDGRAVISGRNQADNPSFDRFDQLGQVEGVTLAAPVEDVAFNVYATGPGITRSQKQARVPIQNTYYDQRQALQSGDTPPDASTFSRVSGYSQPPRVEVLPSSTVGFEAGWYAVTYGWAITMGRKARFVYLTQPAPQTAVQLLQGQGMELELPTSSPAYVPWLAIGLSPRYATEAEALNSNEIWLHELVPIFPRLPRTKTIYGPPRREKRFPIDATSPYNETYVSWYVSRTDPLVTPYYWLQGGSVANQGFTTQIAYKFVTLYGESPRIGDQRVEVPAGQYMNWSFGWAPPFVRNWMAMAENEDGQWINVGSSRNLTAFARAYDLAAADVWTRLHDDDENNDDEDDKSGIPNPDNELPGVTAVGQALPPAGNYSWRLSKSGVNPTTLLEEEGPPGPQASATLDGNSIARIKPPISSRNMIDNAEGAERDNTTGAPEGWTMPTGTGTTFDNTTPGVFKIIDTTTAATNQDVIATPLTDMTGRPDATARVVVKVENYVGGRADLLVFQRRPNGTTVSVNIAQFNANGTYDVRIRLRGSATNASWNAATGAPAVVQYDVSVEDVYFVIRHNGAVGAGSRNLTTSIQHVALYLGDTVPHKLAPSDPNTDIENPFSQSAKWDEQSGAEYPGHAYVLAIRDAPNSMRPPLTSGGYVPGSIVEYFGPNGTAVNTAYFMSGIRLPIQGGEQRTVSLHMWWEGVTTPCTPVRVLVKNVQGRVLQDFGGIFTNVSGDSRNDPAAVTGGWVRKKVTVTAHADAGYIELVSGGAGTGLIRVAGLQYETGNQMTEYNDEFGTSGSLIATFDLAVPGLDEEARESAAFRTIGEIKRITGIGAEVIHEFDDNGVQITDAAVFARSKHYDDEDYTEFFADPEDVPIPYKGQGTIQVGVILSTTDTTVSPVLVYPYLDFERNIPAGPGFGQLLRPDYTEFPGTVLVYNFPPVDQGRKVGEEEMANETIAYSTSGPGIPRVRGYGLEAYLRSTATEIMKLVGEQMNAGILTTDDEAETASSVFAEIYGKRYRLRLTESPEFSQVDDLSYMAVPGMEYDGRWLLQAEGLTSVVVREENF